MPPVGQDLKKAKLTATPPPPHHPSWYRSVILRLMAPMQLGYLKVTLPEGKTLEFGNTNLSPKANLYIFHEDFFKKCVMYGDGGFGDSYIDGDWTTDDLTVLLEWMLLNLENHPTTIKQNQNQARFSFLKLIDKLQFWLNRRDAAQQHKNLVSPRELGINFFKLFLDSGMSYSCAHFSLPDDSLEIAQKQKWEKLCEKLQLQATDHVLDIGCGWGAFAEFAAKNYGCKVTAITESEMHYEWVKKRIEKSNLQSRILLGLTNFRHLKANFDKVVCIESPEALSEGCLAEFIRRSQRLLKPNGLLALQMVFRPDEQRDVLIEKSDWIPQNIFPGSSLTTFFSLHQMLRHYTHLGLMDYEDITSHYAQTLNVWRDLLNANKPTLLGYQGIQESFVRKWNYYFSYGEAIFSMRHLHAAQMIFGQSKFSPR